MNILILSLGGIGNTLLFTPALRKLRDYFPTDRLSVLVMFQGSYDLLRNNPCVDELLLWRFLEESPWGSLSFVLGLRKRRFELSITAFPANRWEYNLINWLIGARRRLGHHYQHQNRRNLNFLHTDAVLEEERFHDVEENLRLIERLGAQGTTQPRLELFLSAEDRAFAQRWLDARDLSHRKLIGFHAGSAPFKNQIRRRWSPLRFAELADILISQHHCTILLFGSKEDGEANHQILEQVSAGVVRVEGTTMNQTAALVGRCLLFVTNDSSLMHVAASASIPTVAIFGPTRVTRVRPFQTPHRIVSKELSCSPCFYYSPKPLTCYRKEKDYACLTWIETGDVLQQVLSLLKESCPEESLH